MKKLISNGAVLENIDVDALTKEDREAHLLTASIKTYVENAMAQATSAYAKGVSVSVSLTQLVTPGSGGRLYDIHQALNTEDQNIGVLQQTLTGICNVVGTLDQKMHNMYQNGTVYLIGVSQNDAPRDDLEVRLSTLTEELDAVQKLTEGGSFNTVVGYFKSLTDVTVWV